MSVLVMAAGEVWTNPIIVGLTVGLPGTWFGVKGYRRAEKLDEEAAKTALLVTQGDNVQRVIDGLDKMIDNLQMDNKEVRSEKKEILATNEEVKEKVADLRRRLRECNEAYTELKRLTSNIRQQDSQ